MDTDQMTARASALCAICDATNATTRICPTCRAEPANDGWVERPGDEESTAEVDEFAAGLASLVTGRRMKAPTPRETQIMELLMLSTRAEVRRYRRRRGIVVVERALTMRQIGEMCGCSAVFVFKVKRRFFR